MKQQIAIKGMTCGGCTNTVEKALSHIDGVTGVTVSLVPPQAIIQTENVIGTERLKAALSKAGNYSIAGSGTAQKPDKSGGSCCG